MAFNKRKESSLTLSKIECKSSAFWLNIMMFLSFQITQTQASHIILKKECDDLGNPARWLNRRRWSWTVVGATKERCSHWRTNDHTPTKITQPRNRWFASSNEPHPPTHTLSSFRSIRRHTWLSLVEFSNVEDVKQTK